MQPLGDGMSPFNFIKEAIMPNWTQNRVVITCEEADVNALVTAVKSEESVNVK